MENASQKCEAFFLVVSHYNDWEKCQLAQWKWSNLHNVFVYNQIDNISLNVAENRAKIFYYAVFEMARLWQLVWETFCIFFLKNNSLFIVWLFFVYFADDYDIGDEHAKKFGYSRVSCKG